MPGRSSQGTDHRRRYLMTAGLLGFSALAAATFLVASFLPLYTDEVVWKLTQGRYFYDGARTGTAFATCSAKSFYSPWILTPFRIFDSFIYQDISGPAMIRNIGVGLALFWGLLAWLLVWRPLKNIFSGRSLACLVIAFCTLGTMPFLLVLNRPEQILLIGMTLFSIPVLLGSAAPQRSLLTDIGIAGALVIFCGYFFSAHPRAVFALPLAFLFFNHVFNAKKMAILTGLITLVFSLVAVRDWGLRSKCDDPVIASSLALDSILEAVVQGEIFMYALHLVWQYMKNPAFFLYISQIRMDGPSTENLIPSASSIVAIASSWLTEALFAVLVISGVIAFIRLASRAIRARRITTRELVLVSLWGFYGFSIIARGTRATYEAGLMVPVMMIASLGSLWVARDILVRWIGEPSLRRIGVFGFSALIVTSVISQAVLITNYVPFVAGSWSVPGYAQGQRFSIAATPYETLRPKIIETANMCGIDPARHPRHLILDELTVFALQPAFQPFIALYIAEKGWGTGIRDYRAYLTNLGSAGMVVGCQWIPTQLQSVAVRNGPFCCVPALAP